MRPGELLEQRYRLVRVLGRGRSGSVWCARNELIDRAVAVKVLHRSLASDPERLQRFFQEARACGRVRHPAVVEVLDLGQGDDGILFLVMELLEGETMASLLGRKGRLNVDEALGLIIPLAHGLSAAHAHGILHRDLKPANIYLHKTPTGGLQPKILDFGISKIIGNDVTATGVVLGTPSYMSPEQARGVPDLDARTDVWSLGVILYELLTGRLPFIAKEYRALVDEIIERPHTPVSQLAPEVPIEVSRIVDELLEKSRDRRLASASAMAQKLTGILKDRGRMDVLRSPEEEYSDGAPTLAKDRDLKPKTAEVKAALAKGPSPSPSASITTQGTGPVVPGAKVAPSALTAAIAAQTAGAKRVSIAAPRPAAGSPARPSSAKMAVHEDARAPVKIENRPEETRPDPLPAATLGASKPEPASARASTTQSWEVSAAQAASGRAEVLLGSAAPRIEVSEDWDTTVADVSASSLEKGPLPKLAPAPPPAFSEPPPARGSTDTAQKTTKPFGSNPIIHREPSAAPAEPPRNLGAIPGFTTAAKPGPAAPPAPAAPAAAPLAKQAFASTLASGSAPPPRPSSPPPRHVSATPFKIAALDQEAHAEVAKKTGPPRPPPKSMPPPGNAFSGRTMRPPSSGFAAPPSDAGAPAAVQPTDFMIAPELYALGDEKISQPNGLPDGGAHDAGSPDSASNPNGDPVVLSASAETNLETDRHRRAGPSLVPMMVAAVAILFFFGAVLGTVAASRRGNGHHARRFATTSGLLVAWHDQMVSAEEAAAKAQAQAEPKENEEETKPLDSAPAPGGSAKTAPAATAPKPVATAAKPAATSKPVSKTTAPTKTTAKPTTTSKPVPAPTTKKGTGDKEWWQKKF